MRQELSLSLLSLQLAIVVGTPPLEYKIKVILKVKKIGFKQSTSKMIYLTVQVSYIFIVGKMVYEFLE